MLTSPTTHKQIRAEAYKLLGELQDKLLEIEKSISQTHRESVRSAGALLLEARTLLRITAKAREEK